MKKLILILSWAALLLPIAAQAAALDMEICQPGTPSRNPALLDGFRSTLGGESYLSADGRLFMQFTDDANFVLMTDARDGSKRLIPLYKDTQMECLIMQGILNGQLLMTDGGGQ